MTSEEIHWLKAKNGNLPAEGIGGKSGDNSRQCGEYSDEAYGVDPQGVWELWDVNLFGKEVSHKKTNGTNSMRNMSYEQGNGPTQENWAHKEVNEEGSIPLGLGAEQGSQISELGLNSSNGLQSDGKKDMNRKVNCVARNQRVLIGKKGTQQSHSPTRLCGRKLQQEERPRIYGVQDLGSLCAGTGEESKARKECYFVQYPDDEGGSWECTEHHSKGDFEPKLVRGFSIYLSLKRNRVEREVFPLGYNEEEENCGENRGKRRKVEQEKVVDDKSLEKGLMAEEAGLIIPLRCHDYHKLELSWACRNLDNSRNY